MANDAPQPGQDSIRDVEQLEAMLSEPNAGVIETLGRLEGDLLVLGVGGKMGPTLARMARRAYEAAGVKRRVIGVSRFSSGGLEARLHAHGIETIRCDLLDPKQRAALPDAPNVLYLAGMKFGSEGQEARTWAMNCYLPGRVSEQYRQSRIVAFSTGNIYGLVPADSGGSKEGDALNPLGDYAMSCLGRERIFEHFSRTLSIPMAMIRLNYATEMRYGVLMDLAQKVWHEKPIDLSMGHLNAIWQADANAAALQAFGHVSHPPFLLNVAGPELLRVRELCLAFGRRMNKEPRFQGSEAGDALLSNGARCRELFGPPRVNAEQMLAWITDWIMRGGETLGKPTHFETRDGKF